MGGGGGAPEIYTKGSRGGCSKKSQGLITSSLKSLLLSRDKRNNRWKTLLRSYHVENDSLALVTINNHILPQ